MGFLYTVAGAAKACGMKPYLVPVSLAKLAEHLRMGCKQRGECNAR